MMKNEEPTTPPPVYEADITTKASSGRMESHEKMHLRAAAFRATKVYPDVVGEFISRELLAWEDFGFRLDKNGLGMRLAEHVIKKSLPQEET